MLFYGKEFLLDLPEMQMDCITFGTGKKTLIMIQSLNTNGIKGTLRSLAFLYRIFSKEYTVYLFDRRKAIEPGITVRELAADVARAMEALHIKNNEVVQHMKRQKISIRKSMTFSWKNNVI